MKPADCHFNFAVPSERTLSKHVSKDTVDANKPGIIGNSMQTFANAYPGVDCKISIDGKKIAYGFGKRLGDEDLCGHEDVPTLHDRQLQYDTEKELMTSLEKTCLAFSLDEKGFDTIPADDLSELTTKLKQMIHMLSSNVRELRVVVSKKKKALHLLQQRVEGDWKLSSLASSISFLKTRIIQATSCTNSLLTSIDKLGEIVSHINGTSRFYVSGFGTKLNLDTQGNFACLKKFTDALYETIDAKKQSPLIKQHTEAWHKLRQGAVVTGSTMYSALGLRSLKEQKQHYDQVYEGKQTAVSDELQELFDYGTKNEINGIATLVGKYLPVFHPNVIFQEDGCNVIPLSDDRIDGDGENDDIYAVIWTIIVYSDNSVQFIRKGIIETYQDFLCHFWHYAYRYVLVFWRYELQAHDIQM